MATNHEPQPSSPEPVQSSPPPMSQGESQWIQNAINNLDGRLEKGFTDLDGRLRGVEKKLSWLLGGIATFGAVVTLVGIGIAATLVVLRVLELSSR